MQTETTTEAPQWAVIELMGHIRYGGQVSKDNQLGTAMLRVDVPQGDSMITQLINPSSIYRLTMCSEEIARAAAKAGDPKPMGTWELKHLAIAAPSEPDFFDEQQDDDDKI
jgi:hypothetical protein